MVRAKYNRYGNGKWEPCFLLKVEMAHYGIKCIIAVDAKNGDDLVLEEVKGDKVRIVRTRIEL